MTVYATFNPTSLRAGDKPLVHRPVILNGGAALARGAILGRITSSDLYILSVATASDGSQNPIAVLAADADPSGGNITVPAYFEGEFAGELCTFDSSWTIATLQTALRKVASLIYIRSLGVLG